MGASKSIVKSSERLRDALKKRFIELNLSYAEVVREANSFNVTLEKSQLSRYMKGSSETHIPTEDALIWLAIRYCIPISLQVGKRRFLADNTKTEIYIPTYNENEAMALLNKIYPEKSVRK